MILNVAGLVTGLDAIYSSTNTSLKAALILLKAAIQIILEIFINRFGARTYQRIFPHDLT
jgi:hypothetical protein